MNVGEKGRKRRGESTASDGKSTSSDGKSSSSSSNDGKSSSSSSDGKSRLISQLGLYETLDKEGGSGVAFLGFRNLKNKAPILEHILGCVYVYALCCVSSHVTCHAMI